MVAVARALKVLALLMGVACALIGVLHLALGIDSVPGEGTAGATVDSREHFYGAIFLGYGLAWMWAARQVPIPAKLIRFLTLIFALSALGRIISLVDQGRPQWFQLVLTAIEIVLPPVFFWLAGADERRVADRTVDQVPAAPS